MALPILDGNQTATTLSSVVTGGEHIVAHSVVSLGPTAISNIASAVSGIPISGTVAITEIGNLNINDGADNLAIGVQSFRGQDPAEWLKTNGGNVPISGTVTVGNSVTIGSIPAISGTVTANVIGLNYSNGQAPVQLPIREDFDNTPFVMVGPSTTPEPFPISGTVTANLSSSNLNSVTIGIRGAVTVGNSVTIGSLPAISGTVTANVGNITDIIGGGYSSLFALGDDASLFVQANVTNFPQVQTISGTVTVGNSVTIGSLPAISGTVTVGALPSGSLTTRFGSVTTANTAQITSAVTNTSRKYLLAQNISAGTVTIGIGFSPTTTQGIQLTAGGGLTFDAFCPTDAVYWLGAVTGAAFTILEG